MHLFLLDPKRIRSYTPSNRRPRRSGKLNRIVGVFVFGIAISFSLLSCAPNPDSTVGPVNTVTSPPSTKTQEGLRTTPLPRITPTSIPTHTPISCLHQDGTIEVHEIRHPDLVSPIRLRAYLPPCYEQDTFATYPSLILLHGLLATDSQWDNLGIDDLADQLIHAGASPPFIILMPWIRNSQDPHTVVMDAMIPFAEDRWRLSDDREFWAIGGISRGAGQALQIGLLHPDRFSAIGLHSPAILHAPELLLSWYLAIEEARRPAIWFDIGESDSLFESAMVLLGIFQGAEIKIADQINTGDHTSEYWMENLPDYLNWYVSFWLSSHESGH
jgi:enterochelin esterase-like enzyme